jgi:hypothetical protein
LRRKKTKHKFSKIRDIVREWVQNNREGLLLDNKNNREGDGEDEERRDGWVWRLEDGRGLKMG